MPLSVQVADPGPQLLKIVVSYTFTCELMTLFRSESPSETWVVSTNIRLADITKIFCSLVLDLTTSTWRTTKFA